MVSWLLSAFVTSSLQALIEKLANLGLHLYYSVSDVDYKLKRLERTLFRVQSIIHDAEDNQRSDKAWQLLVRDLEALAYDADDLIDEIVIKVSELHGGTHDYKDQVSELLLSLFKVTSAPSMNNIQVKLDDILKEMESLCMSKRVQGMHLSLIEGKLQSSSLSDEPHAFGRATVRRKMINTLLTLEDSEGNDVSVISIVGMVGVGKTTLAQLVYNYNYHIHAAFNLQMWVSVPRDFNVIKLTKSILEAATGEASPLSNLDQLQLKLRKLIRGKKFMLVLDDVWIERQLEWDLMLKPLKVGSKGSIIIVTTRSHVVSSMVGTRRSCYLKCLSNEHCWSLVREKALGNINLNAVPNLIAIGKEIARKCKGLPLAAKTLGVLLHSRVDEGVWKTIQTSRIWDLPEVQNEVHHGLRSSYHHLHAHLKHCFAYCSLFPENYHFERDVLVRMWMAEGFIQVEGCRPMEDIGRDYFDQLLSVLFFEEENGKYNMHEAVHHFSKSVSSEKFFRMENMDLHISNINSDTRHSSVLCEVIKPMLFEAIYNCKGLHTLLMSGKNGTSIKEVPFALFQKLGRLRVLDLSNTLIEDLSGSIGNLRHLRYLDLSNTLLRCLPETIHQLCSLQTLRALNCSMLLYLPKGIEKLTNLQHLELGRNIQLTSMPQGIGKLRKLQTLREFVVGPNSGQIEELEGMDNIRGTLTIKQLEKVNNPQEAHGAKLSNKRYLDKLEFQWSSTISELSEEHVLNNLQPHENLSELTLRGYGGFMFPTWMSNPLFAKLTSICLYECGSCLCLPSLGKLPNLSSLKLGGMHALQEVCSNLLGNSDGVAFGSLKRLELRDMDNLASWSGAFDLHMSCLLELTIIKCPSLITMPSLHSLGSIKKLRFENCPQLQSFTSGRLPNSLQSLQITACPIVTERFSRLEGVDWINIAHIPMIEVDGENV